MYSHRRLAVVMLLAGIASVPLLLAQENSKPNAEPSDPTVELKQRIEILETRMTELEAQHKADVNKLQEQTSVAIELGRKVVSLNQQLAATMKAVDGSKAAQHRGSRREINGMTYYILPLGKGEQ